MITIYERKDRTLTSDGEEMSVELRGLSTDTKPTSVAGKAVENGSTFIEIDTGKILFFDAENEEWKEV